LFGAGVHKRSCDLQGGGRSVVDFTVNVLGAISVLIVIAVLCAILVVVVMLFMIVPVLILVAVFEWFAYSVFKVTDEEVENGNERSATNGNRNDGGPQARGDRDRNDREITEYIKLARASQDSRRISDPET
jgi:hypothetical protein